METIQKDILIIETKKAIATMETIKPDCQCKRLKCDRHGNCAACKEYHTTVMKYLPYCERLLKKTNKGKK